VYQLSGAPSFRGIFILWLSLQQAAKSAPLLLLIAIISLITRGLGILTG
jgi:hypothetical protein